MAAMTTAIIAGAGVAMQAYSSVQAGKAAKKAAKLNAQDAMINAEQAQQQALEDERQFRLSFKRDQARNVTSIAASGIKMEGSPLEVLQDNAAMAEGDALRIRQGGQMAADAYRRQAKIFKAGGQASERAGYISGASDLLKGGVDVYNVGQKSGAWS